jgi:hypothetical protein
MDIIIAIINLIPKWLKCLLMLHTNEGSFSYGFDLAPK